MASKLAPHCLKPTSDARLLVEAGCRLVKLVNDFGSAAEYLALRPDLTLIGRGYCDYTLLQQLESGDSPEQAAARFVRDQRERYYALNPLIKIWEGHNEPSFGGPNESGALARMEWYGRFEAERLRLLTGLGLRGVIGNFSTGYPEVGPRETRMWEAFLPALAAARDLNGLLGLHEYSAPWVWWLTGNYQEANCPHRRLQPGWREENIGDVGWLTLRYRQVYRYALAPRDLDTVPLVITELGCDAVGHNCPGTPSGAWKDLAGYWDSYDGARDQIDYWRKPRDARDARDTERYYAEQLIWYDREIQKDAYVLGATIFTFGSDNSTWERYNVAGTRVTQYLATHIRQTSGEPTLPLPPTRPVEPPPPPQPSTSRGQPREQYSRIYVLLPPTAVDPAWVEAVADATWRERHFTIGASADDAGIGNLHARMVVIINPQGWGVNPPIDQWFAKNYPGVVYVSLRANSPAELKNILLNTPLPAPIIARPSPPQAPTGLPREPYERTYILLNPGLSDPDWVKALARATWARRVTIGGSSDDAGIGDLTARRIIAINPGEGWGGDLLSWFEQYYPGVSVESVEGETPNEVAQKVRSVLAL
ncbi:MAG: hypothetical protein HYZ49_04505 [Chloroflexi bacterium]|nr:hypothetical protein [Chloroflexota bacterium]